MNVFDFQRELNRGLWRLPLYQCPVNLQLDTRDINTLKLIPDTCLCIRICNSQPEIDQNIRFYDHEDGNRLDDYMYPEIHQVDGYINQDIDHFKELGAQDGEGDSDFDDDLEPVA